MESVVACGASLERQPDTVAVTTHWHIPGGCDYHNAYVVIGYWSDMEAAQAFAKRNDMPPEMADCTPIAKWDEIQAKIKAMQLPNEENSY